MIEKYKILSFYTCLVIKTHAKHNIYRKYVILDKESPCGRGKDQPEKNSARDKSRQEK